MTGFQLTQRVARSVCDSRLSCLRTLSVVSYGRLVDNCNDLHMTSDVRRRVYRHHTLADTQWPSLVVTVENLR